MFFFNNNNTAHQVARAFPSHLFGVNCVPSFHVIFRADSLIVPALSSLFHCQHLVSFDVGDERTLSSPAWLVDIGSEFPTRQREVLFCLMETHMRLQLLMSCWYT